MGGSYILACIRITWELIKTEVSGPHTQRFLIGSSGAGFRICISNELPADANAAAGQRSWELDKNANSGPYPRPTESDSLRKDPEIWVLIKSPNDSCANQSLRCTVPLVLLNPGYIVESLGKLLKYSEAQASLLESLIWFLETSH